MKNKLSNNTLLKFFNKELSEQETERIKNIINNSENYKNILNELDITYGLIDKEKRLKNNSFLYFKIINKLNEKENQSNSYNLYFIKKAFQPIAAIILILITLYTGFKIGNIYNETDKQLTFGTYKSEFYFNDLQMEKMENILLTTE